MPLPHAYTFPCTVQLRRRVVNLASPFHRLNTSCTALHMHRNAPPLVLNKSCGMTIVWAIFPRVALSISDSSFLLIFVDKTTSI